MAANGDAGMAMLVTHISAAAASLAWITVEWIRHGKPSVLGIVTGMVAGLGTITPASGYVGPAGALIIGLSAGVVCYFATQFIKRALKIDDSLDVFPVHGVGGMLGTLLAGVFASEQFGGYWLCRGRHNGASSRRAGDRCRCHCRMVRDVELRVAKSCRRIGRFTGQR